MKFSNEIVAGNEAKWDLAKNVCKKWICLKFSNENVAGNEAKWDLAKNVCKNESVWNFLIKIEGTNGNVKE